MTQIKTTTMSILSVIVQTLFRIKQEKCVCRSSVVPSLTCCDIQTIFSCWSVSQQIITCHSHSLHAKLYVFLCFFLPLSLFPAKAFSSNTQTPCGLQIQLSAATSDHSPHVQLQETFPGGWHQLQGESVSVWDHLSVATCQHADIMQVTVCDFGSLIQLTAEQQWSVHSHVCHPALSGRFYPQHFTSVCISAADVEFY